ncbi:MAG: T9SS type A sorting domain-containing protein [Flavobacteriales bacterium]|nr:T9SS type A sorting domain-containing protein [Flavobacteriales bacterium]
MWPNPVSETIKVRAGSGTLWHVYDARGRLMASGTSATELMVISVQPWAPGEYVLRLQGESRKYVRFVVMR